MGPCDCPVLAEVLTDMIHKISQRLGADGQLEHLKTDFAKNADMLTMQGQTKRKRQDIRIALELPQAVASSSLAPTTSAYMKAHPGMAGNSVQAGKAADVNFLCTYQAATWLENDRMGDVGLIYDATRAGTPGTDTLNTRLVNCERRTASWLPVGVPQMNCS